MMCLIWEWYMSQIYMTNETYDIMIWAMIYDIWDMSLWKTDTCTSSFTNNTTKGNAKMYRCELAFHLQKPVARKISSLIRVYAVILRSSLIRVYLVCHSQKQSDQGLHCRSQEQPDQGLHCHFWGAVWLGSTLSNLRSCLNRVYTVCHSP